MPHYHIYKSDLFLYQNLCSKPSNRVFYIGNTLNICRMWYCYVFFLTLQITSETRENDEVLVTYTRAAPLQTRVAQTPDATTDATSISTREEHRHADRVTYTRVARVNSGKKTEEETETQRWKVGQMGYITGSLATEGYLIHYCAFQRARGRFEGWSSTATLEAKLRGARREFCDESSSFFQFFYELFYLYLFSLFFDHE